MPGISQEITSRLLAKAAQSVSAYRVAGCAISKKGEILGFAVNAPYRQSANIVGKYTGRHAEAALIQQYGDNLKTIIILRIGLGGDILPIDPCPKCAKLAEKYGIKVISVEPPKKEKP